MRRRPASSMGVRAVLVVLALTASLAAGDPEARRRFREELGKVYDYLPAEVEQDVRDRKVAEMDGFWAFVASDLDTYLPLLREALRDEDQNRYFCFDGSALLFEHSKSREDLDLVVSALCRSRVEDVGTKGYFYFVHRLCGEDVDALPAVEKILQHPDYRVLVPQHAMQLAQADAVLFCLMRQKEDRWVPALAERLAKEKDRTAMQTIVFALGLAVDGRAEAALRAFDRTLQDDAETRQVVAFFLAAPTKADLQERKVVSSREAVDAFLAKCEEGRVPWDDETILEDAFHLVGKKDEPRVRAARRKAAARVSDEAMGDIRYLTHLLRSAATSKE